MRRRGAEHETAAGWQKLAACVNDDIRPPTIQLSRSGHIHSIQRACLPSDTCSFSLVFVRSLLHSAKFPDRHPFTSKRVLFPSVRMWNTKAPGHAGPLHRWKHTNYVKAMTAFFFWVTYFPRPNKNPVYIVVNQRGGWWKQFGQSQQSITARRDGAGGKSGKRPTWREWLSVGKQATGGGDWKLG